MGIEYYLQQLVNGICLGGMYALMSVGYSLVYSIMNFSNFAHGAWLPVPRHLPAVRSGQRHTGDHH